MSSQISLTHDELRSFDLNGYIVVRNVVPDAIADANDAIDSMFECESVPPIALPEPTQIRGNAGDVVFAHYLLSHNSGGNYESSSIRRCIYYRLRKPGHAEQWRDAI